MKNSSKMYTYSRSQRRRLSSSNSIKVDPFTMGQFRFTYALARRNGLDAQTARTVIWTTAFAMYIGVRLGAEFIPTPPRHEDGSIMATPDPEDLITKSFVPVGFGAGPMLPGAEPASRDWDSIWRSMYERRRAWSTRGWPI